MKVLLITNSTTTNNATSNTTNNDNVHSSHNTNNIEKCKQYTRSPLEDSRLFGPSPWKILATTYEQMGS